MFKDINLLIKQNISFAIYRLPNQQEPTLIIGNKQCIHTVSSIDQLHILKGFVIAPFEITSKKPIVCIEPEIEVSGYQNISNFLGYADSNMNELVFEQEEIHYKEYRDKFDIFLKALEDKNFDKLVLSRVSDLSIKSPIPYATILKKALNTYPNSFVYLCHTPQTGTWLGATPELLLKGTERSWETVALAGTQKKEDNLGNAKWDQKNIKEQQLVSEHIKNTLDANQIKYNEQAPKTIESGDLLHLRTDFSFELEDSNQILQLLQQLHPTPAICGRPKEKAYRFILEKEGYDRSYYSGFIGYFDLKKDVNLYVNLRCMNIEPTHIRLYAGGGILESSDPETEWAETEAKIQAMLSLLNKADDVFN